METAAIQDRITLTLFLIQELLQLLEPLLPQRLQAIPKPDLTTEA
jgi:hypothetical protein